MEAFISALHLSSPEKLLQCKPRTLHCIWPLAHVLPMAYVPNRKSKGKCGAQLNVLLSLVSGIWTSQVLGTLVTFRCLQTAVFIFYLAFVLAPTDRFSLIEATSPRPETDPFHQHFNIPECCRFDYCSKRSTPPANPLGEIVFPSPVLGFGLVTVFGYWDMSRHDASRGFRYTCSMQQALSISDA